MAPCKDIAWLFLTTPPFLETSLLITNQPSCLPVSSCSLSLHIRISSLTFSPSSLSSSLIFTSPPLSRSLSQLSNASAMINVKRHKKLYSREVRLIFSLAQSLWNVGTEETPGGVRQLLSSLLLLLLLPLYRGFPSAAVILSNKKTSQESQMLPSVTNNC